jgi:hypothetical protein
MRSLLLYIAALAFPLAAHIGVNDVFFEGLAGPYPLYVTIRPPVVIPGVAEISIRSAARDLERITITPMTLTGPGSVYPPTPDAAVRSTADPQLFNGSLWIMFPGSWQVRIAASGKRGPAQLSVPVRAVSQRMSTMDPATGTIIAVLIALLALGAAGIAGAALGEAQLAPGTSPDTHSKRRGRIALAVGGVLASAIVYLGWLWWGAEAAGYANSIYRSLAMKSSLRSNTLSLDLQHTGWTQARGLDDLIEDHRYPMHLYAVRKPSLDAIYHLHPKQTSPGKFELPLPAMPAGEYQLFADIVHKSGFPETLSSSVLIPEKVSAAPASLDDAGAEFPAAFQPLATQKLASGLTVRLLTPSQLPAQTPHSIRFAVEDQDGNPAANLQPYLEMPAHLAILNLDLKVFSHVHPSGNISMAAYEIAQKNLLPISGNVLRSLHVSEEGGARVPAEFSFPFGFPRAGKYRLFLQFRASGGVQSAAFDFVVL